jgi:undecaprenyl pyrophosphate phosphatase UppP
VKDWLAANLFLLSMPVFGGAVFLALAKAVIALELSFESQAIGFSAILATVATYLFFKALLKRLAN